MANNMKQQDKPKIISLIENFGNNRINYKNRIQRNQNAWLKFYDHKNRKSKDLTTYANELLDGELFPIYKLVYDYAGSRIFITKAKHEILVKIRKETRAGNVKEQLKQMLLNAYNDFRLNGAIRNSDKTVLAKYI